MTTFVLATANPHKSEEMTAVLNELGYQVLPRPREVPDVDETADTLVGNARLKAHALAAATGHAAIADDTGLFVEALDGRPGVYSARYAGPTASDADNVEKVLTELRGVPEVSRGAFFRTVIVVAYPDGSDLVAQGELAGVMTEHPRGSNGFGYDVIFAPHDGESRTLAEFSAPEKNAMSHRSRALRALVALLTRN